MSEYADASKHKALIGKRAKIGEPQDYCEYLWGKVGTIEECNGHLFLKFDTPATSGKNDVGMDGVYLTETAFKLLGAPNRLTLVSVERYGGGDGKAINKHVDKEYVDAFGNHFILSRCLDAVPPYFEASGPFRPEFVGFPPMLRVEGKGLWGDGISWQKAYRKFEAAALAAGRAYDGAPAVHVCANCGRSNPVHPQHVEDCDSCQDIPCTYGYWIPWAPAGKKGV